MKTIYKFFVMILFLLNIQIIFSENIINIDNMTISWKLIGNEIEFDVSAKTTGWLAIGFEPTKMMKNADIIIMSVVDGKLIIEDHFANGFTSHKSDVEQGGSNNVVAISGSESGGYTYAKFRIPVNSPDLLDKQLLPGNTYKLIIAYGKSDNMVSRHSYRGSTVITF